MGCVGNDNKSKQLEELLIKSYVKPLYQYSDEKHTGECLAFINEHDRSLIADLGACSHFKLDFYKQHEGELNDCNI